MKNQKGITLIALVITIIVLLILAGVSIAMLTGENGILTNATESKNKTLEKSALEKIDIALNGIKTTIEAGKVDSSYKTTDDDTLITAAVTGITDKDVAAGYAVTGTPGSTITITYTNAAEGVTVSGSINTANNKSTITPAAVVPTP